jgi:hypothetical protein
MTGEALAALKRQAIPLEPQSGLFTESLKVLARHQNKFPE